MGARLKVENVSYRYPPGGGPPALEDVCLELDPGEVLVVAGSNGSGKSTLAQVCSGLIFPDSGEVLYEGKKIKGRRDLLGLRKKVGLVFQSPEDQLFADTVSRDISFGPRNHGVRGGELEERLSDAAELAGFDLDELGPRSPFSLSEGEKRKVALAGVFAMRPEVLVLDEPFVGLDYDTRDTVTGALARFNRRLGASILIVTHELSEAWDISDSYAVLSGGRLRSVGSRMDFLSGSLDLTSLGMRLPQWGRLSSELIQRGLDIEEPSNPACLARALVEYMEKPR